MANKLTNITNLLKSVFNLQSLIIDSSEVTAENICLLVPDHVKHLQVTVQHIDDIKLIIEQLKHLSSVTFEVFHDIRCLPPEFLTWLMKKRNKSTYRNDKMFLNIWLGKINS